MIILEKTKKFFGTGEKGLGLFGKQAIEGVRGLREIREQKVQPFIKEKIVNPVFESADLLTEKFTKPLLKGELPIQRNIVQFIDKGMEEEAKKRVEKGSAKNMENAAIQLALEDMAFGITGTLKNEVSNIAKEFLASPKVKNTFLSSVKKVYRKLFDSDALQKYGDEGKQIFNKIKESEKYATLRKSEAILKLDNSFKKMNEQDFIDFGDMVEGFKPVSESAKDAVQIWKGEARHIANAAKKYGIEIKIPVEETIERIDNSLLSSVEKIEPEFTNLTMEGNYQSFKELLKDVKVRSLKVKEAVLNGDLETFRRELVDRGIMDKTMVDNITYSQEMTGDDVLNAFKDRLLKENPQLLMGKKVAENLGYKIPAQGITEITRTINKKIPFSPKENYYPYFLKEDILEKILSNQTKYNEFLEILSKQMNKPVAKVHEIMTKLFNNRADFYGHLERARGSQLPKEFYERDPKKILSQYLSSAWDRIGDAKVFGGDDSLLQNLIEQARIKGEDFESIQDLVNRALGREKFNESLSNVSDFARAYNNFTKLSLAAVTNLGDLTKTFVRSGFYPTLKAIVQSFTQEGKTFAGKVGVIEPLIQRFAQEQGYSGLGEASKKFFKYSGFQFTEQKIRQIASNAGKNYVQILVNKLKKSPSNSFILRRLEQFGIDGKTVLEKGLKPSDLLEAGYQAIADTQPISQVDLPYYWQSPMGKLLTQYKSFAYKQYKFTKKFIWGELKKGNPKPVLTFLFVGSALGEGVGDLKAWLRGGRKRPDRLGIRIIDNLMTIGGFGLATDFLANLQYGTMGGGFLKFIAGPTLSDIDAWLTAIQGDVNTIVSEKKGFTDLGEKSKVGKVQSKILKKSIYSLPFFGPALSNQLFPTKNEYKARTIPIAEEILDLIKTEKNK